MNTLEKQALLEEGIIVRDPYEEEPLSFQSIVADTAGHLAISKLMIVDDITDDRYDVDLNAYIQLEEEVINVSDLLSNRPQNRNLTTIPQEIMRGGPIDRTHITHGQYAHSAFDLESIFFGANDLHDIDLEFLLDEKNGMIQTIYNTFLNAPGRNNGRSALRHIMLGDKTGGMHVPALARIHNEEKQNPSEPFAATVKIGELEKFKKEIDQNGNTKYVPLETSMFPRAFDSLTVIQSIIDAYQHKTAPKKTFQNGKKYYETEVENLANGGSLTIALVTAQDRTSEKVVTAYPKIT